MIVVHQHYVWSAARCFALKATAAKRKSRETKSVHVLRMPENVVQELVCFYACVSVISYWWPIRTKDVFTRLLIWMHTARPTKDWGGVTHCIFALIDIVNWRNYGKLTQWLRKSRTAWNLIETCYQSTGQICERAWSPMADWANLGFKIRCFPLVLYYHLGHLNFGELLLHGFYRYLPHPNYSNSDYSAYTMMRMLRFAQRSRGKLYTHRETNIIRLCQEISVSFSCRSSALRRTRLTSKSTTVIACLWITSF